MRYIHLTITALFSVCLVIAGFAAVAAGIFAIVIAIAFQDPQVSLTTLRDDFILAGPTTDTIAIAAAYGLIAWHCWRIRNNATLWHLRFLHRKASDFARIFTTLAIGTGIVCAILTAYQFGATCEQGDCDGDGLVTFGLLAIALELGGLACYCWRIR